MALTSPRLSRSSRLRDAADNSPALRRGEQGAGVWIVQQALIDLGYAMPVSTRKYGSPDGIFGRETYGVVRQFQSDNSLGIDGIAGKNTLHRLDELVQSWPTVGMIYDVPLIAQNHAMGCWAAGISMLIAWKDNYSVAPVQVANRVGYIQQLHDGLIPDDHTPLTAWGLETATGQTYTVQGFYDLLEARGPLWVAAAVNHIPAHIRVVTGIHVGRSATDTVVFINDPWEIGMINFRAPNRGSRYTETYLRYERRQRTLAYGELDQYPQGIYVSHWPGLLGSPGGGGPALGG